MVEKIEGEYSVVGDSKLIPQDSRDFVILRCKRKQTGKGKTREFLLKVNPDRSRQYLSGLYPLGEGSNIFTGDLKTEEGREAFHVHFGYDTGLAKIYSPVSIQS